MYHERLWVPPSIYLASALLIPAVLIVFAPINLIAGAILAVVLYLIVVGFFVAKSAIVEIDGQTFTAGRARIPLNLVGDASAYTGDEAILERGRNLDARAWLLIRGYIKPVVKVPILDADDPAPYWLVSTRRPKALVRALAEARVQQG